MKNALLVTQFGLVQDLIEQLLANQIDCAIATQKIAKPELEYQLIFEENFWLVGSPAATVPQSLDSMQTDLTALDTMAQISTFNRLQRRFTHYSAVLAHRFWSTVGC